jgi:hypothetical protein
MLMHEKAITPEGKSRIPSLENKVAMQTPEAEVK